MRVLVGVSMLVGMLLGGCAARPFSVDLFTVDGTSADYPVMLSRAPVFAGIGALGFLLGAVTTEPSSGHFKVTGQVVRSKSPSTAPPASAPPASPPGVPPVAEPAAAAAPSPSNASF